jgi:competence ComEA-like helix-hairpin-helix protein
MLIRISSSIAILAIAAAAQGLPDGPGKNEVLDKCSKCHGIEVLTGMVQSRQQWDSTISSMVDRGAEINADSYAVILDYLSKYLGTTPPPQKINVNKAAAKDLESGLEITGKEAETIVKYRDQHGPFKDWHDLTKIDGVDAKKIESKKDLIALE